MTKLVIDLQGFTNVQNEFIVKEFAAYNGVEVTHQVFQPPTRFEDLPPKMKRTVWWLMTNYHCINWDHGSCPLYEFDNIVNHVTKFTEVIYMKGREKVKFLREFLPHKTIIELDEQPRLQRNRPRCSSHSKNPCMCAVTNVIYLYKNSIIGE